MSEMHKGLSSEQEPKQVGRIARMTEALRHTKLGRLLLGPTREEVAAQQEERRLQYAEVLNREERERTEWERKQREESLAHFRSVFINYTSGVSPLEPLYDWETPKVIDAIRDISQKLGKYTELSTRTVVDALLLDVETVLKYVVGDTTVQDLPRAFAPLDEGVRPYFYRPPMREKEYLSGESEQQFQRHPAVFLKMAQTSLTRAIDELASAESILPNDSFPFRDLHERIVRYEERLRTIESGKDPKATAMMAIIHAFKNGPSDPGAMMHTLYSEKRRSHLDDATMEFFRQRLIQSERIYVDRNTLDGCDPEDDMWALLESRAENLMSALHTLREDLDAPEEEEERKTYKMLCAFENQEPDNEGIAKFKGILEGWGAAEEEEH